MFQKREKGDGGMLGAAWEMRNKVVDGIGQGFNSFGQYLKDEGALTYGGQGQAPDKKPKPKKSGFDPKYARTIKASSAKYATDVPGVDQQANRRPRSNDNPASQLQNTADTGRGETRTNELGVRQTGTQTGVKAMTLADANALLSPGYQIENPFTSVRLPATNTSTFPDNGKTQPFNAPATDINTGASQQTLSKNLYDNKGAVEFGAPIPEMPASGYIESKQKEGSPELVQNGASDPKNSGINWGARTMADNSDENVRRRHAMLDTSVDIGQAMRNQEAIQGRGYYGGQHYQFNPDANREGVNQMMKITADDARSRSFGTLSAQDVYEKHKAIASEKVKSNKSTDTAETKVDTKDNLQDSQEAPGFYKDKNNRFQVNPT